MRKRQYGNRWQTQFVPLCREEVKRLEERQEIEQSRTSENSVQEHLSKVENDSLYINRRLRVTL
jgi:hypothetical protein